MLIESQLSNSLILYTRHRSINQSNIVLTLNQLNVCWARNTQSSRKSVNQLPPLRNVLGLTIVNVMKTDTLNTEFNFNRILFYFSISISHPDWIISNFPKFLACITIETCCNIWPWNCFRMLHFRALIKSFSLRTNIFSI